MPDHELKFYRSCTAHYHAILQYLGALAGVGDGSVEWEELRPRRHPEDYYNLRVTWEGDSGIEECEIMYGFDSVVAKLVEKLEGCEAGCGGVG